MRRFTDRLLQYRVLATIALFCSLLPALLPRLGHPLPRSAQMDTDFNVYYTAAILASQHRGILLYDGADTGIDPQLRIAETHSIFAQTARSAGIASPQLYVYPPTLADLLVPFTYVPVATADRLWTLLNLVWLILIAGLMLQLLEIPIVSWPGLVLLTAVLLAQPVQACLTWGQITIFLALLWVGGMFAYRKGWIGCSAALFALATAIKLTPVLVVILFLIWKDWKWLRAFAVSSAVLLVAVCLYNSPATPLDYVIHVLPSMSRAIPNPWNHSIVSSIQLLYGAFNGFPIGDVGMRGEMPTWLLSAAKLVALSVLSLPLRKVFHAGVSMPSGDRVLVLALIATLSAAVAPVSWMHAYTVSIPALAIVWSGIFRKRSPYAHLILLAVCTAVLTTSSIPTLMMTLHQRQGNHDRLISLLSWIIPGAAICFAYVFLPVHGSGVSEKHPSPKVARFTTPLTYMKT